MTHKTLKTPQALRFDFHTSTKSPAFHLHRFVAQIEEREHCSTEAAFIRARELVINAGYENLEIGEMYNALATLSILQSTHAAQPQSIKAPSAAHESYILKAA